MKRIFLTSLNELNELQKRLPFYDTGCVAALGFFDGMHIAHRSLLAKAKSIADSEKLPLVVFTFASESLGFKGSAQRLFSDEEKLAVFEDIGVDYTVISFFSVFKNLSAEEFVESFLVKILNTHTAVCGFNFKFGRNAAGNAEKLCSLLRVYNRDTVVASELKYGGKTVSTTEIKALLTDRKIREATRLLGSPYSVSGTVEKGLGLGKKLGIPTVNIAIDKQKFTLPQGVYFTLTLLDGEFFFGITNIGSCPTFEEREIHTETYILGFDGDLYGRNMRIYFVDFLRDEKKFSSKEELIMQINIDKKRVYELAKEIKCQDIGLNLQ